MQRRFRLQARDRFQQVRRQGQSREERFAILVCLPNDLAYSRFGFSASRRVGKAVQRNRARRLLRESVRLQLSTIAPGWDMVFIARASITQATFAQVDADCRKLLKRAGLLLAPAAPTPPAQAETPL